MTIYHQNPLSHSVLKKSYVELKIKVPKSSEMFVMSSDLDIKLNLPPCNDEEMEIELSICKMVTDSRR